MLIDYEILRVIWWGLLGFLLIGFGVLGGIDLGCGMLLPFVSKDNTERRILINSIGPTWESNQVWFILGGGAIFAAWPLVYSVVFSTMHFALFMVLAALILRPVGFDYRNKIDNAKWRNAWDSALFIGGLVPTLIFGVAIGNLLEGIRFSFDEFMVIENHVEFFSLLSPFALLCGVLGISLISTQGASFLMMKTEGNIFNRSRKVAIIMPILTAIMFLIGGYLLKSMGGYQITSLLGTALDSNPLNKEVLYKEGGWLLNYNKFPWIIIAPCSGFVACILVMISSLMKSAKYTFIFSSISIISIMSTVGLSMFPFIVPSVIDHNSSLTVWDASSSYKALAVMLGTVVVFMPIVLFYISFVYKVMFGKVTEDDIKKHGKELY